jgi:hypothetical protein
MIANAYRALGSFVILQRTNAALATPAGTTAAARGDCSALHRFPLFHVGGVS